MKDMLQCLSCIETGSRLDLYHSLMLSVLEKIMLLFRFTNTIFYKYYLFFTNIIFHNINQINFHAKKVANQLICTCTYFTKTNLNESIGSPKMVNIKNYMFEFILIYNCRIRFQHYIRPILLVLLQLGIVASLD